MRRALAPVVALAIAATIAAAAFGLVAALPQPTHADRIGVRVLQKLERSRGQGSLISIGDARIRARCRRISPYRELVTLSDGTALVLKGSHIRAWRASSSRTTVRNPPSAALRAAEADLAGSYRLYAVELAARLESGDDILGGSTSVTSASRAPSYSVVLSHGRPRVELIIRRDSLRPVAVRLESARLRGTSSLVSDPTSDGAAGC